MTAESLPSPGLPGVDARGPVGSIVQAVAVLRHLGAAERGQGVTAIARQLGISPSSCFNVLKTLVAEDLVSFDPAAKTYALGLGAADLARVALGRDAVLKAARDPMGDLAERFDAAVGLWRVTARERLILVALSESEAATRIHLVIGQRQPATAGATGRAVLAARGVDDATIAAAFALVRWQQAPGERDFVRQVNEARRRGWALDSDQINRGITTVASAICDVPTSPRFCLTASMFTGRDTPAELRVIGEAVRDVAAKVAQTAYGRVTG